MKTTFFKDICWLFVLAGLIFILNLWGYPLFDVDEPRYAETAREMLTTPGDWITPHFNWMTRFDKPVLFYWLIAFSYKLFGISAFSARLVSALAATGIMVMIYMIGRQSLSRRVGLISAAVFATMLEPYLMGRWSVTDMSLACFMTGTWFCLLQVLLRSPKWYLMAGVFAGLGVLTKGPVAFALPSLSFLISVLLHHRPLWKRLFSPWVIPGLGLFLAIALPWYMAVAAANPKDFVGSFFFLHNVERFTSTVSGHHGPWWYYFPVILAGAFPWVLLLPGTLVALWKTRNELPPAIRYALVWFLTVFLFFSIAGTKLLTYILPGFPALAILLAWFINLLIVNTGSPEAMATLSPRLNKALQHINILFVLSALVSLALLVLVFDNGYFLVPQALHDLYHPIYTKAVFFLFLLTFTLGALYIHKQKFAKAYITLQTGMAAVLVVFNIFILPQVAHMVQDDMVTFAQRSVTDKIPLATYDIKKPSLVFYTQQKTYYMERHDEDDIRREKRWYRKRLQKKRMKKKWENEIARRRALQLKMPLLYLIVKNKDINFLKTMQPYQFIQAGRVYSLVLVKDAIIRKDINE